MQVEVNEANIDRFNLVELTGNTRELMLSRAAEARSEGHILSCNVPDEIVLEQNVFEIYESEHVDPRRLRGCMYEDRELEEDGHIPVCVMHGKASRHDAQADPYAPCIQVDPEVRPSNDEISSTIPKSCVYNKVDDPRQGTVYICAVHGKPSKYDVTRVPSLPCLVVDPMSAAEGDPHRP